MTSTTVVTDAQIAVRQLTFSIDLQSALALTLTVPDGTSTEDVQGVIDNYNPSAAFEDKVRQWILEDLKAEDIRVYGFETDDGSVMPSDWTLDEEESGNLFVESQEALN